MHGCVVDGWVFFFSGRYLYGMAESLRTAGDTFGLGCWRERRKKRKVEEVRVVLNKELRFSCEW